MRNADFFSIDFVVAVMYLFPNFILISFLLAFSFFSFCFCFFTCLILNVTYCKDPIYVYIDIGSLQVDFRVEQCSIR